MEALLINHTSAPIVTTMCTIVCSGTAGRRPSFDEWPLRIRLQLLVVANEMRDSLATDTGHGDIWAFLVYSFLCSAANASLTSRGALEMETRHPVHQ